MTSTTTKDQLAHQNANSPLSVEAIQYYEKRIKTRDISGTTSRWQISTKAEQDNTSLQLEGDLLEMLLGEDGDEHEEIELSKVLDRADKFWAKTKHKGMDGYD